MKLLISLIFLSSCSLFVGSKDAPTTAKGTYYTINFKEDNWVSTNEKRSDYIFENTKDGRILLSNSFCDEFQEQPLDLLATKTFKTVNQFKVQLSEYTIFKKREAYRLEGTGMVDGVKVNLHLLNTRRNNCYFDFVAITPEKSTEQNSSFDEFLKAVDFE
jgi:hypothetical protein